jgi:hypothetical protein
MKVEELYQKAIHKYIQHAADSYLGGGDEHIYGANKFDNELFGVSSKRAQRDFDRLFPHYVSAAREKK